MPKRRYSKQTYPVSPEFIEGPKEPEYKPEKEEKLTKYSASMKW